MRNLSDHESPKLKFAHFPNIILGKNHVSNQMSTTLKFLVIKVEMAFRKKKLGGKMCDV